MWIGLLWYFNFVADADHAEDSRRTERRRLALHRAGGPVLVPLGRDGDDRSSASCSPALNGYLVEAYTLESSMRTGFIDYAYLLIGIGMWLGTIMWFNVWFVIWPNQQKALNIGNAYPDLPADQKAAAAQTAGMFSRINTMLSIPMLFCMVAAPRGHLA